MNSVFINFYCNDTEILGKRVQYVPSVDDVVSIINKNGTKKYIVARKIWTYNEVVSPHEMFTIELKEVK